jgi:hypothetical protein
VIPEGGPLGWAVFVTASCRILLSPVTSGVNMHKEERNNELKAKNVKREVNLLNRYG